VSSTIITPHGLAPASNKEPRSRFTSPPPSWGREENGKKKAKVVGRDKGSLIEQNPA